MAVTRGTQDRDEPIDVARSSPRSDRPYVCAECKYAKLFAVQTPVVCTCEGSASRGMVHFADQPACADLLPRADEEMVPSASSSDLKKTRPQFASTPARMH